jgi:hypothetical protein
MELPIAAPAPVVTDHTAIFRTLFDSQCQFRHFQRYLTGLIVLPNKSMANIARCILDSADKTDRSRFLAEAPWRGDAVNRRRIGFMLQQTKPHRRRRREPLKNWISLLKKTRRLETVSFQLRDVNGWAMKLPGPHIAVEALVPLIPATAYRAIKVREQASWCFTLGMRIAGLGKVRIVVSFEDEALTGRSVVLVRNRVDWRAAKIMSLYLQRWPAETFGQASKGHLGFTEYRMRSIETIGKHWCLVFVAYSRLQLTFLPAVPDRTKGLIHTMGDACRQPGRALLQRLLVFVHDQLSQGATVDHPFAQLFAKAHGMVSGRRMANLCSAGDSAGNADTGSMSRCIRQYQGLWGTISARSLIEAGRCLCQATRKRPSVPAVDER